MNVSTTERGFEVISHPAYPEPRPMRLVQQSSVIGEYDDAFNRPGSSALWIGDDFHLSREQVAQLRDHLSSWLKTGSLRIAKSQTHKSIKRAHAIAKAELRRRTRRAKA